MTLCYLSVQNSPLVGVAEKDVVHRLARVDLDAVNYLVVYNRLAKKAFSWKGSQPDAVHFEAAVRLDGQYCSAGAVLVLGGSAAQQNLLGVDL